MLNTIVPNFIISTTNTAVKLGIVVVIIAMVVRLHLHHRRIHYIQMFRCSETFP